MHFSRISSALLLSVACAGPLLAQNTLKDGTSLLWDKEIAVGHDSLAGDSAKLAALSIPVYEASASQVWSLLKKELPGADFKKAGRTMKAPGVSLGAGVPPMDLLASVTENKKARMSTLVLAPAMAGTANAALEAPVRDLAVKLNKAVVQGQLDEWTKKLGKADSKTSSANKDRDKAQGKLNKAQAQVEKIAREKSKLQSQRAIMQKEIDLYNQKWTLSQDPKDFKKLTKSRANLTKNDGRMAKLMDQEAKAQKELTKSTASVPDAQKATEDKAAAQAEVQRTVDALQRKLESIR